MLTEHWNFLFNSIRVKNRRKRSRRTLSADEALSLLVASSCGVSSLRSSAGSESGCARLVCDEASAAMQEHIFALRRLPPFLLIVFGKLINRIWSKPVETPKGAAQRHTRNPIGRIARVSLAQACGPERLASLWNIHNNIVSVINY